MDDNVKNKKANDAQAQAETDDLPAVMPSTPEQIEQLKERAAKADEYWDRLLRQTADFDNYKKRAARERQDSISYANESLLTKLLPVLDAFEMALAAAANAGEPAAAHSLQAGIVMISNQLKSVLAESGLEEINAGGKPFDPNLHEAVSEEATNEVPDGHVVRQIRKGYRFRNRLIRPAGVVVAKKP
ncbi:MAG TPA: nucleotide exchange factor GrpE [Verrucomicrobiae bacterium]|jgi:molecular chaperone GrpE|nr:nucleotide exchange factor GrpE [Verrucomicrobiae bacterium]